MTFSDTKQVSPATELRVCQIANPFYDAFSTTLVIWTPVDDSWGAYCAGGEL